VYVDGAVLAVTRRPTLLTLRASGLGDFLTSVPALRALRRAHPEHMHLLAAPPELWPLAQLCGGIDALVPTRGLSGETPVVGADLAVNLHGRGPQSHALLLRGQPRRSLAFAHADVTAFGDGPVWVEDEHDVRRWCRLLGHFGIDADPSELDLHVCDPDVGDAIARTTVLHPGAGAPARQWPEARWIALGRAETDQGRSVAVTAGLGESSLARRVADGIGAGAAVVSCAGSIEQLVDTIASAGRVVSGDTGVAHLATALGTPSVVLFGPTSPARWGPPPDRPWHIALWAGSTGDPHASRADPGLLELTVPDVVRALSQLPSPDARAVSMR
jgi:ADP-heptose:LPS heptosyltransferase